MSDIINALKYLSTVFGLMFGLLLGYAIITGAISTLFYQKSDEEIDFFISAWLWGGIAFMLLGMAAAKAVGLI